MEMEITISLSVSIADEGANVNEICQQVKKTMQEVKIKVPEQIIEGMQEDIIERLTTPSGRVAKKGLGKHKQKGNDEVYCKHRTFRKKGFRVNPRHLKTDIGELELHLHQIECRGCGKKLIPLLDSLDLSPRQRHSESLEQIALEAISETSYRRGEQDVEARGCAPVPRSSAHRWAATRVIPEGSKGTEITAMADGTGFKKWPGQRGEIRIVLGLSPEGKICRLGTYAGKSWEEISKEVKEKLSQKGVQLKLFTEDGERGLEEHLGEIAERSQRCQWHLPRAFGYTLWKESVGLDDRKEYRRALTELLAIEVPGENWEEVSEDEKANIYQEIQERERSIGELAKSFRLREYYKAAAYLENAMGRIFSHLKLWLETGVIAPRTVSILESIMREIGRRVKRIGWNWSDRGVEQISKMVLMRHYGPEEWQELWQEILGLRGRCQIKINRIARKAA